MNLRVIIAFLIGVLEAVALVYLITDRYNTLMNFYNFAIFLSIFLGGSVGIVFLIWIFKKIRKSEIKKEFIVKKAFHSIMLMNVFLIIFGFTFYDFTSPRNIPYGSEFQNVYRVPEKANDDWSISSLTEEGLDSNMFNTVVNKLVKNEKYKKMHSMLIIKNGYLVGEEYFYDNDKDKPHDLRSANKSITSILMGIAIDKGYISGVDAKLYEFFPEYNEELNWDEKKKNITIDHLLSMSSGLDCNDWYGESLGNENKLYKTDDWIKAFLELPYKQEAGAQFSYCTFGEILARSIIVKASGMSIQKFSKKYLFEPLNITKYEWTMTMPNREDIGVRVSLTSRDFAKLGQLYLNGGIWNGKKIVSRAWVNLSTQTHSITNNKTLGNPEYGYLWWKNTFEIDGRIIKGYQAQGNGGQLVFVVPEFDLIVTFTAGNYNNPRMINAFNIMKEDILPSLM